MEFTDAAEEDFEACEELFYQVFRVHLDSRGDIFREGRPLDREGYLKILENKNEFILLCRENGGVVGLCHAKLIAAPEIPVVNRRLMLFIDEFCVREGQRGRGVGTALFAETKRRAAALGADSVELNVWNFNRGARKFYSKLGFEEKLARLEYGL